MARSRMAWCDLQRKLYSIHLYHAFWYVPSLTLYSDVCVVGALSHTLALRTCAQMRACADGTHSTLVSNIKLQISSIHNSRHMFHYSV